MIDITSGNYAKWYEKSGKFFKGSRLRMNQVIYRAEMNAYRWEIRFGDYNYAQKQYDYYSNLTKLK